jgi:hypothetical protein
MPRYLLKPSGQAKALSTMRNPLPACSSRCIRRNEN